jgi:hypothetical protein
METNGTRKGAERRTGERVPYSAEVTLRELSGISGASFQGDTIAARVENLSESGMCVSTRVPLMFSTSVRCDVGLKDLPLAVPTVAQVRWVYKVDSRTYRSGLRYLL